MTDTPKFGESEAQNEQVIGEIINEIASVKNNIESALREADDKLDQDAFLDLIKKIRDDLHNMEVRAINSAQDPRHLKAD